MAITRNQYTGDGSTKSFAVTFSQLAWTSIQVFVNYDEVTTGWTYDSTTQSIVFDTAPVNGALIVLSRLTDVNALYKFKNGAAFTGANLDSNFEQFGSAVEEVQGAAMQDYVDNQLDAEIKARQEADASLQSQITAASPILANEMSVVTWHGQTIENSVDVPDNMNAFSVGPQVVLAPGQAVNLGENSTWTILNGTAFTRDDAYTVTANKLTTSDGTFEIDVNKIGEASDELKNVSFVFVESFADSSSAAGDWSPAIQNAINYARDNNIPWVYGKTAFTISSPIRVEGFGAQGININLNSLTVNADAWPANTGLWDATPIWYVGDSASNLLGINIWVGMVHGGDVADYMHPYGNGVSLSNMHVGLMWHCNICFKWGMHTWPNASMHFTGDFWQQNNICFFNTSGTTGTTPITEGWVTDVKFIADNDVTGAWYRNSGQYSRFHGSWDYNGKRCAVLHLTDATGLTSLTQATGQKLTNGTTTYEYLWYYPYRGQVYVVVLADDDISYFTNRTSDKFLWTATDTISCSTVDGVALKFDTVELAGDNGGLTNFFDVFHDFDNIAYAKLAWWAEYISQIIGSQLYTSNINYTNGITGINSANNGFGLGNSGYSGSMVFANTAVSNDAIVTITKDTWYHQLKFCTQWRKNEGIAALGTVPSSTDTYYTFITIPVQTWNDTYADEGNYWKLFVYGNYAGIRAEINIFMKGDGMSASILEMDVAWAFRIVQILDDDDGTTVTGYAIQIRQEAQPYITFLANLVRF